jgi:hypothetical protein
MESSKYDLAKASGQYSESLGIRLIKLARTTRLRCSLRDKTAIQVYQREEEEDDDDEIEKRRERRGEEEEEYNLFISW